MEIGRELQCRREQLGISLEKIEYLTNIQKRYLRAIESGEWDQLPAPVYTRGFIHSYARIVGMDLTDLLLQFDTDEDDSAQSNDSETALSNDRQERMQPLAKIMKFLFNTGGAKG